MNNETCQIIQFADDFCIVKNFNDNENPITLLQDQIDETERILNKLNLKINFSKCKVQIFKRSNRIQDIESANLRIKGEEHIFQIVKNVNYLGVNIDCNLNFKEHTKAVKARIEARLNPLRFIMGTKMFSNPVTCLNLAKALIVPMMDYSIFFWISWNKSNIILMESVINKTIKLALGVFKCAKTVLIRGWSGIDKAESRAEIKMAKRLSKAEGEVKRDIIECGREESSFKEKLFLRKMIKDWHEEEGMEKKH